MTKTLLCISTYQKTDALATLVRSLVKHGYDTGNRILVCDDNANQDYKITKKDNPNHPVWTTEIHGELPHDWMEDEKVGRVLGEVEIGQSPSKFINTLKSFSPYKDLDIEVVFGDKRGGVAINKNRGIKYFLEHPEFDELLMLDDDIEMVGPGLLEAIRATKLPHVTGLLGGSEAAVFGSDACPFFQSFPPQGETPTHWYCLGSMGVMLYATRECVEKVGYMDILSQSGYYGFEHSCWSGRINMLYGKHLDWFPILKGCENFFVSQSIPNNYVADFTQNQKGWLKRKEEIFRGIDLHKARGGV